MVVLLFGRLVLVWLRLLEEVTIVEVMFEGAVVVVMFLDIEEDDLEVVMLFDLEEDDIVNEEVLDEEEEVTGLVVEVKATVEVGL